MPKLQASSLLLPETISLTADILFVLDLLASSYYLILFASAMTAELFDDLLTETRLTTSSAGLS